MIHLFLLDVFINIKLGIVINSGVVLENTSMLNKDLVLKKFYNAL